GGPATNAQLDYIFGIAVDSCDNLFIGESSNNDIREVDPASGIISLYAGIPMASGITGDNGPATAATFMAPWGVAIDTCGNLYIADILNPEIRMINNAPPITGDSVICVNASTALTDAGV